MSNPVAIKAKAFSESVRALPLEPRTWIYSLQCLRAWYNMDGKPARPTLHCVLWIPVLDNVDYGEHGVVCLPKHETAPIVIDDRHLVEYNEEDVVLVKQEVSVIPSTPEHVFAFLLDAMVKSSVVRDHPCYRPSTILCPDRGLVLQLKDRLDSYGVKMMECSFLEAVLAPDKSIALALKPPEILVDLIDRADTTLALHGKMEEKGLVQTLSAKDAEGDSALVRSLVSTFYMASGQLLLANPWMWTRFGDLFEVELRGSGPEPLFVRIYCSLSDKALHTFPCLAEYAANCWDSHDLDVHDEWEDQSVSHQVNHLHFSGAASLCFEDDDLWRAATRGLEVGGDFPSFHPMDQQSLWELCMAAVSLSAYVLDPAGFAEASPSDVDDGAATPAYLVRSPHVSSLVSMLPQNAQDVSMCLRWLGMRYRPDNVLERQITGEEEEEEDAVTADEGSDDGRGEGVSCVVCQQPAQFRCGGCHGKAYCSAECQRKNWKMHKTECKQWQAK